MFQKRKGSQVKEKRELLSGQVTPGREQTAGSSDMRIQVECSSENKTGLG